MRIAFISDIHGNLPALEAVLEDISRRGVDETVCLGDLVGKGPSNREVVSLCFEKCRRIVAGNWDSGLYKVYRALQSGGEAGARAKWFVESAGPECMELLGALPHFVEFYMGKTLVRAFHAHPKGFTRYFQSSPKEKLAELFAPPEGAASGKLSGAAVYADIHRAYMTVQDGRILVNCGSVGNPLDVTQASYVILSGSENALPEVSFVRVGYDIEKAVAIAEESAVPDFEGYKAELKTAVYYKRE